MSREYTFDDFVSIIPCLTDKNNLGVGKTLKGHVKIGTDMISLENGYVTVMFYAKWCGHCEKLAPKYVKAFMPIKLTTLMCRVDSESPECKKFLERFNIRGYPTILRFKNGKLNLDKKPNPDNPNNSYEGRREPFDIMCYAVGLENDNEQCSRKYPQIEQNVNN